MIVTLAAGAVMGKRLASVVPLVLLALAFLLVGLIAVLLPNPDRDQTVRLVMAELNKFGRNVLGRAPG